MKDISKHSHISCLKWNKSTHVRLVNSVWLRIQRERLVVQIPLQPTAMICNAMCIIYYFYSPLTIKRYKIGNYFKFQFSNLYFEDGVFPSLNSFCFAPSYICTFVCKMLSVLVRKKSWKEDAPWKYHIISHYYGRIW